MARRTTTRNNAVRPPAATEFRRIGGFFALQALLVPWALASCLVASSRADDRLDSEGQIIQRRTAHLARLPPAPSPPQVSLPCLNPIDQFIAARWIAAGLEAARQPPEVCDDASFARRVYLDLIGVIPSVVELNRFLADTSATKRDKLIEQLLARNEPYAAHWAPFWEDALASQPVLVQGGIPTRGNYRDWIVRSFQENRPYDVLVAELIDPTMPRRHGAATQDILGVKYSIEYVRNEDHTVTLQTAANVAQVFLGTSMKCASCHDHFENREWTQDRFLGFAGLFAAGDLEHIRCEVKSGRTVPARFPFELDGMPQTAPVELNDRLHLLAQWIVDPANPRFARTLVNRLWKRYLGWGLFEPADDFRLDVPVSHPELLDWLAYDFLQHGCDLKHTIALIVGSRTYQLRYDPRVEDHFDVGGKSQTRYFRSPVLRRLTAEQLLDSIRMATTGQVAPAERSYLDIRSTALTRALGKPASRNEVSTSRPDDAAVVQALELLNGPELQELLDGSVIFSKALARQDPKRLVDQLYRSVLSRPATTEEKRLGQVLIGAAETPQEGLKDLFWALFCSPEFQYIK